MLKIVDGMMWKFKIIMGVYYLSKYVYIGVKWCVWNEYI
jgi:hypothetical protein